MHADAFEDHLVEVEERDPVVGPFVPAHRLPQGAREYGNVVVMPPSEGTMIVGTRIPFMFPDGPGRKQA